MKFDLNIENYTRDELIQMFELPNNFDRNIVDIKESKLREGIINNHEINKDTRVKTLNFLLKAKNIILNDIQPKNNDFQRKLEDFYKSLQRDWCCARCNSLRGWIYRFNS